MFRIYARYLWHLWIKSLIINGGIDLLNLVWKHCFYDSTFFSSYYILLLVTTKNTVCFNFKQCTKQCFVLPRLRTERFGVEPSCNPWPCPRSFLCSILLSVSQYWGRSFRWKVTKCVKDRFNFKETDTYNKKSCSQHGVAPLTVTVVDFTFCSFKVTYVLNWDAEKRRRKVSVY